MTKIPTNEICYLSHRWFYEYVLQYMFEINRCCLNINYLFNDQIHVRLNQVYFVTIHISHTLMGGHLECVKLMSIFTPIPYWECIEEFWNLRNLPKFSKYFSDSITFFLEIFICLFDFKFSEARIIWSIVMLKDGGTESDVLLYLNRQWGHIHAIRRDGTVLTGVAVGSFSFQPTFVSVNDQVKINVVGLGSTGS
jgi:hypothetical protein